MSKSDKSSVLASVIGIAVVTAIAVAAGVAAAWLLDRYQIVKAPQVMDGQAKTLLEHPAGTVAMTIPTVLTNLAGNRQAWIRAEFSVLLFGSRPTEALADEIANDTVAYLRTVTPEQISGLNGLTYLREDIEERVRIRTNGTARGVLFKTLVVE